MALAAFPLSAGAKYVKRFTEIANEPYVKYVYISEAMCDIGRIKALQSFLPTGFMKDMKGMEILSCSIPADVDAIYKKGIDTIEASGTEPVIQIKNNNTITDIYGNVGSDGTATLLFISVYNKDNMSLSLACVEGNIDVRKLIDSYM